jgi:deferrochelatase/peroxidase EfeB
LTAHLTIPNHAPAEEAPVPLELADIQANVLRGHRADYARHFALSLPTPAAGAALLASLTNGDENKCPQVSTAEVWKAKPEYCLNVGFTSAGLTACGVPAVVLSAFPEAFRTGAAGRSSLPPTGPNDVGLGDIGTSAPDHWILGGTGTGTVHILISLSTCTVDALEARSAQLRRARVAAGPVVEVSHHDATALPGGTVHFGYRDGISQPWIEGTPGRRLPDMQPTVATGDFLLGRGYRNQYHGNFLGAIPPVLGDNGTFSAFRILGQDVAGFEAFLSRTAERWNLDPELVAAKLLGRWRNGVPLVLSPDTPHPATPVKPKRINKYDYAPGPDHPAYFDDDIGLRCPIGAHMRRLNPRGALVMGRPHSRRIVRRGMPYGPAFDPSRPDDSERGLIGHFICGDLESQFEFIHRVWANQDLATSGLRGSRDPFLGAQPQSGGRFTMRTGDNRDPVIIDDLPRLVQTRGGLYCFLPGLGALRYLARGVGS